jgi:hypothetical protein
MEICVFDQYPESPVSGIVLLNINSQHLRWVTRLEKKLSPWAVDIRPIVIKCKKSESSEPGC